MNCGCKSRAGSVSYARERNNDAERSLEKRESYTKGSRVSILSDFKYCTIYDNIRCT